MRRTLLIITLAALGLVSYCQTGTGWYKERRKVNNMDSVYFAKDVNFIEPIRIDGVSVTSMAAELNILDGALCSMTELNYLVGVSSNIQSQLNAKQATLVSGTNIKTVNGTSLLGSGNVVIEGGEGGSMVYPGAGIPISTGLAWGTSITNNSVNWDSAYVARLRWSGTATGLTASTGRTSLGGTTVGQNLFTLTNPDAIRFIRLNADNTVTALSAANFKTALSLTSTDVGLGNVTNESKATMFTNPTFTGTGIIPSPTGTVNIGSTANTVGNIYLKDGGSIFWGTTPDVSIWKSALDANAISIATGSLLVDTGTVGRAAKPIKKGWFTDLNVTNAIAGSVTGNAATVTGFTRNSGALTLSGGHGITLTTTGITSLTLPTSGTLATNPMSAVGDIIIGGTAGAATRLTAGTNGYVLTMASGSPTWAVTTNSALETRIDSIVTILADTMNIETLLDIDLDTDTVADLSEVRLRVLRADSTDVFATPTQINDTIDARIAAATVGLAAADTNTYGGATTRTFVESLLGSGSGLSAQRLPFIIGVTTGAPSAADTIVVHSEFEGKHIDLYRDGAKQYQQFTATNIYEGFRLSNDTIYVNPAWQANEQVMVDIIEPILWSYLSLEGQESSLLDSLRGYWKLDETSGITVTDATGIKDGYRWPGVGVGVPGKLGYANTFNTSADVIDIDPNTNTVPKGVDFSFAAWVKLDTLPSVSGHENYIFQQNVGSSPWKAHWIQVDNADDRITCGSRNTSGTAYYVYSTDALEVGVWYHIAFVNPGNGQDLVLYVNGSDVSATAGTFSGTLLEGLSTTCIGNAYYGVAENFEGIIDSPALWGRALTSGEVTTLYNLGNGKTYPFN